MGILSWIVFGSFTGVVAEWILPGRDPGGITARIPLGIGGAVIGGMLGTFFGFGGMGVFDVPSLMIAVGGALILLFGYQLVTTRFMASPRDV